MVNRKFFPLFGASFVVGLALVYVLGGLVEKHPRNVVLMYFLVMSMFVPFLAPWFFIPTKRKWRKMQERQEPS